MEDGGNIRVPHAGGGPRLAQKPKPRRLITKIPFANRLQGYRIPEIDVERFVGDAHRPTTQLNRSAILVQQHFILVKPSRLRRTFRLPRAVG
jgi:hypothetical protein